MALGKGVRLSDQWSGRGLFGAHFRMPRGPLSLRGAARWVWAGHRAWRPQQGGARQGHWARCPL